jgi:hypothetical protein
VFEIGEKRKQGSKAGDIQAKQQRDVVKECD